MDGRGLAAQAAQEAQETLSSLRENAEKYLRLRLGVKILQAEIERYREKSQGPVLRRAAELFALVTEKRFVGLEPDYGSGDEPVLVGVRENGEKVALAGMSDGTQDQLYLALRLASLEKFSADGEPLPLLVDDALVNFDNARARAALKVLGDLGGNDPGDLLHPPPTHGPPGRRGRRRTDSSHPGTHRNMIISFRKGSGSIIVNDLNKWT